MFFIAYAFKGQVHVFAGRVKIVSLSSCRTNAMFKYFFPLLWQHNLSNQLSFPLPNLERTRRTAVQTPWARTSVLVQPRKTCPFITEKLLMGHKKSNQTNKTVQNKKYVDILQTICTQLFAKTEQSLYNTHVVTPKFFTMEFYIGLIGKMPWNVHFLIIPFVKLSLYNMIDLSGPRCKKTCLWWFSNNKGADQPAHTRSLISTFIFRVLESIISKRTTSSISTF